MEKAVELLTAVGIDLLTDPQVLKSAKAEFEARKEGQDYQCLLSDDLKPPIEMNKETMRKYPVE